MIYKYYAIETVKDGKYVGSRVYKVPFYKTPFYAMRLAMANIDGEFAIVNLRRIK